MKPTNKYSCPWCGKKIFRYNPVVPVATTCWHCHKAIRLVGGRFLTWRDWQRIKPQVLAEVQMAVIHCSS